MCAWNTWKLPFDSFWLIFLVFSFLLLLLKRIPSSLFIPAIQFKARRVRTSSTNFFPWFERKRLETENRELLWKTTTFITITTLMTKEMVTIQASENVFRNDSSLSHSEPFQIYTLRCSLTTTPTNPTNKSLVNHRRRVQTTSMIQQEQCFVPGVARPRNLVQHQDSKQVQSNRTVKWFFFSIHSRKKEDLQTNERTETLVNTV